MRFSRELNYLYLVVQRKLVLIYELKNTEEKIKKKADLEYILPFNYYEEIVNIAINDSEITESLVAVKKKNVKAIEIVSIDLLSNISSI